MWKLLTKPHARSAANSSMRVSRNTVYREVGLLEAPVVAVRRTGQIVSMMVETIGQVVTGRRSVAELGGPLSIAKVSGEQITLGPEAFVFLIALVSINGSTGRPRTLLKQCATWCG